MPRLHLAVRPPPWRKDNRNKDIALWLADDDEPDLIGKKEKDIAAKSEEQGKSGEGNKTGGGVSKDGGTLRSFLCGRQIGTSGL